MDIIVITSIINAFTAIVLVIVTYYSVKKLSEQNKFMSIDRKRPRILDEVKRVLTPYLEQLEIEINHTGMGYGLHWLPRRCVREYKGSFANVGTFSDLEHLNVIREDNEIAFYDIIGKYPKIKSMFEHHDLLVTELEDKFQELEYKMFSGDFKEICIELFENFKRENIDIMDKKYFSDTIISFIIPNIMPLIVNNTISIESTHKEVDIFWKKYRKELIKIRDENEIKKLIEELDKLIFKFSSYSLYLRDALKKIREEYRNNYNLTNEELKAYKTF